MRIGGGPLIFIQNIKGAIKIQLVLRIGEWGGRGYRKLTLIIGPVQRSILTNKL